jgi:predicted phosphoribosyltransferase
VILPREKPYADRRDAAERLSESLTGYGVHHPLVLGIPRGGVVIADVVSRELNADLDVVLTRKLGAPDNPELAIGAVAENGAVFVQRQIADQVGADEGYIQQEKARQLAEIRARRDRYRTVLPKMSLEGRSVILVDDGIATGATMQASIWAAREEGASRIMVAVPVGSRDAIERLARDADEVICPHIPEYFYAIGQFFEDFGQVSDEEVMEILRTHSRKASKDAGG